MKAALRMRTLAEHVLCDRRKGWLRSRPIFEAHAPASEADLAAVEARLRRPLPDDLRSWLVLAGFGDIDRALSFRSEWIQPIDEGELAGGFRFAQDELGNFYGFGPAGDRVVFLSRFQPVYAVLAPSFHAFLEELVGRDYKINEWVDSAELVPCTWSSA